MLQKHFWFLAVSSQTNPLAKRAQKNLAELNGCFLHVTHQPAITDENVFRKLGIWVSTDGIVEKFNHQSESKNEH